MANSVKKPESTEAPIAISKQDLTFGWHYITARKGLLDLLLFQVTMNIIWGMVGALIIPIFLSFTRSDQLGAVQMIASVLAYSKRSVRQIDDTLPDTLPAN